MTEEIKKNKIFQADQKSGISDTVKGFRDYLGIDALKRAVIKDILMGNFRLYGFEPAETPIIEFEEFVKGENQSDEVISDIFKLQDKGKRKLALRYELTFQLKRISKNKKLPYKRYQIGEVFRDEPVSSNRFRQFTQCDADVIGSTVLEEAEILAMSSKILKELGIKAVIYVNNRKLLNEILDSEGIKDSKIKAEIIKELDKIDKLSESEVKKNLKKYKADKILSVFSKSEKYFEKYASYKEIQNLKDYCDEYGVKVEFLPSLSRGLSYYNGSIWEIKTKDMKETIIAGGSYLISNVQSTGISFGLERISQLAKMDISEKRIVIIGIGQDKKAIELAESLREKGFFCSLFFNKVSKALEYANSYSVPFVIFLGEEEVKKKKFKLRNMKSGEEKMLDFNQLIENLA
jgi:histidyl-tRNA synthetase